MTRDVACHNLYLMELTHLCWNARKCLEQATSTVTDNATDDPTLLLKMMDSGDVFCGSFVGEKFPVEVNSPQSTAENHHTKTTTKVGRIYDENSFSWRELWYLDRTVIEFSLDPPEAFIRFQSQISVGLSLRDIPTPQVFLLFFSLFILENMLTFFAFITLSPVPFTIFFDL